MAASRTVSPISFGASSIIPRISRLAGTKHISTAGLPIFFSPDRSSPRPALVRIMIRAIFRNSDDMPRILSSNKSSMYGPRTIPVTSNPSKPGSFIFRHIQLMDIPTSKINEILNNINSSSITKSRHLCLIFIAEVISFYKRFKCELLRETFIPR